MLSLAACQLGTNGSPCADPTKRRQVRQSSSLPVRPAALGALAFINIDNPKQIKDQATQAQDPSPMS